MGLFHLTIPATGISAGANVANGQKWQLDSKRRRKIVRVGLVGGAAAADTKVSIFFGSDQVMELYNTSITQGMTKVKCFWHTSHVVCFPGTPINVIVDDLPNTNEAILLLDIR